MLSFRIFSKDKEVNLLVRKNLNSSLMVKIALWNHRGLLINYNFKSFFFLFYLKTVSFLILVCTYQIIKILVGYVILNKFDGIFLADQNALINSCCSNIQNWELIKPSVLFRI